MIKGTNKLDADDVVLVALMNNPRDLEIARNERWYRIPVKHAPADIRQARYVAFYLTKKFGEQKYSICEYAPVQGHELVYRRDLFPDETDHPRANDAYYKLQLGSLLALKRPIVSRAGRRMLFIWTTGDKFSRAVELNDLLGKSDADDALWNALKDANIRAERQVMVRDKQSRYRIDFWIPCKRGNVGIAVSDAPRKLPKAKWGKSAQFSTKIISEDAGDCARQVNRLVREMGGIKYSTE